MKNKVKEFCSEFGITEDQFYGKTKIGRSLYLSSVTSIPEGWNPTVGGYLYLSSVTSIPEGWNPTVGGSLDLSSVTSIPEGWNPTVGGSLYLSSVTSIPEGWNPTVGGYLYLSSVTSIPEGWNPTVGGSLDLSRVTSIPEGWNPTVGGSLYLSSVTSIPEGWNPTVGGSLYLSSVTSIPEGWNPTVGGSLYLSSVTSIPEGWIAKKLPHNFIFSWNNGQYIKVDEIFSEVVSNKGNVYHVKNIGKSEITYLITDGNGKWSHGNTLKEAKDDLMYKVSNRRKDDYTSLDMDSVLPFEEGIQAYRVITGACSFGTKDFVENHLEVKKEEYKVSEIIRLTEGHYGNTTFREFFS